MQTHFPAQNFNSTISSMGDTFHIVDQQNNGMRMQGNASFGQEKRPSWNPALPKFPYDVSGGAGAISDQKIPGGAGS